MINLIGGSCFCLTGGIETVNRTLVAILHARGELRTGFFRWDDWASVPAEHVGEARHLPLRFFNQARLRFVASVLRAAWRWPRDFWFVTHVNYLVLGYLAAFCRPGRVTVMLHAAELDEPMSWLTRRVLACGVRVIAISNFTCGKAVALGVPRENISVLYHGRDVSRATVPERARADDRPRLLFVGRMDERYKGQAEILDAAELLETYGVSLRYDFAGGGVSLATWQAEVIKRGLQRCVTFHGRVSNEALQELYGTADFFVMPSQNEGFGLVYVEAMSAGLPCVASNVDAAQEIVAHGETGFCVPFGNSTALVAALTELARDPALRQRMGEAGLARYRAHFTRACFVARLEQFLAGWTKTRMAAPA